MSSRRCDFGMGLASCRNCCSWPILNRGCGNCGVNLCSKCARVHRCNSKRIRARSFANAQFREIRVPREITNSAQGKTKGCSGGNIQPPQATAGGKDDALSTALATQPYKIRGSKDGARMRDYYRLGSLLGKGAFGVVHACGPHNETELILAVKLVDTVRMPLAEIVEEVAMMEMFDHENVLKLHDVFYENRFVGLVMDRYRCDMFDSMQFHWETKGSIVPQDVVHVVRQMMAAIQHMHMLNVIHRDVKGENFLMTHQNIADPANKVVISDFGTSRLLSSPWERLTARCGTPDYWAPEFYAKNYSLKADTWALGVVVYGMFAMTFPFRDENSVRHKQINVARFGDAAADFVQRCLEKVESKRFSVSQASAHPWLRQEGAAATMKPSPKACGRNTTTLVDESKHAMPPEVEMNLGVTKPVDVVKMTVADVGLVTQTKELTFYSGILSSYRKQLWPVAAWLLRKSSSLNPSCGILQAKSN